MGYGGAGRLYGGGGRSSLHQELKEKQRNP